MSKFEGFPENNPVGKEEKLKPKKAGELSEALERFGSRALLLGSLVSGVLAAADPAQGKEKEWEKFIKTPESKTLTVSPEEMDAERLELARLIKPDDLTGAKPEVRERLAEEINLELASLDTLSVTLTQAYKANGGKVGESDVFQMAENARQNIIDAGKMETKTNWLAAAAESAKKWLAVSGSVMVASSISNLAHEIGHRDASDDQNIESSVFFNPNPFGRSEVVQHNTSAFQKDDPAYELTKAHMDAYNNESKRLYELSRKKLEEYAEGLKGRGLSEHEQWDLYLLKNSELQEEYHKQTAEFQKAKNKELDAQLKKLEKDNSDLNKKRKLKDSSFIIAGINRTRELGSFLADTALGRNGIGDDQFLAMLSLVSRGDGAMYSLRTLCNKRFRERDGNDIANYAKNTGTSVEQLALGLSANYFLNPENYSLLKIALGEKGVKVPETVIAPFYELEAEGPVVGVRVEGKF